MRWRCWGRLRDVICVEEAAVQPSYTCTPLVLTTYLQRGQRVASGGLNTTQTASRFVRDGLERFILDRIKALNKVTGEHITYTFTFTALIYAALRGD